MTPAQIVVDWQDGKFAITTPYWANELIKRMPSRRWSKAKRHWIVPLLKQTVMGMDELLKIENVRMTDPARAQYDAYRAKATARAVAGPGFPAWYPFKLPPRPHQRKVLNKKWGKKAFAVHHDMGTGKTYTEINYGCALRMEGLIDSMLVMVKFAGRKTWEEEFELYAPIPYDMHLPTGGNAKGFVRWLAKRHDFKVMVVGLESLSEGSMHSMVARFLAGAGRVFACVDESSLISNHQAKRTERIWSFRPLCEYRDTMTGTPISKAPLDLFSQFEWLDPDIIGIGDFYAFRNRYATVIQQETKSGQKYPLIVGYQNLDELTKLVAPYTDEVRKSEVLAHLPPKTYKKLYIPLSKPQRELYDQVKSEGSYAVGDREHVIKNVLELALRLHTIASGMVTTYDEIPYIGRKGDDRIRKIAHWHPIVPWAKNPKHLELLDLTKADCQFIIWTPYRAQLAAIVEQLNDQYPKESVIQIHGDIGEQDRATWRHEYQRGKHKFMVGTQSAGGMSNTWTACETMIYMCNTEKMIDRAQSEDRAHRDGLTHPVLYVDLISEKTVDVSVYKSIEMKINLSDYIRANIKRAADILDGNV